MAYAVEADLTKYFGSEQVLIAADRDGSGAADTDVITTAIDAASEEIDSYLAVRYDLPLSATPSILTRVCSDLAMYHMSVTSGSMTDDKEIRYKNGIKWLMNVSKGNVSLGAEEAEVSVQDRVTLGGGNETRRFTRTNLSGIF